MTKFIDRHIGVTDSNVEHMLQELGYESLDKFIETVVPQAILEKKPLAIGEALDEQAALKKLKEYARKNILYKSFIGQGYYNSFTPPVIQRNIFENPGWYTCLLYTSPSPRDLSTSRMPSSA